MQISVRTIQNWFQLATGACRYKNSSTSSSGLFPTSLIFLARCFFFYLISEKKYDSISHRVRQRKELPKSSFNKNWILLRTVLTISHIVLTHLRNIKASRFVNFADPKVNKQAVTGIEMHSNHALRQKKINFQLVSQAVLPFDRAQDKIGLSYCKSPGQMLYETCWTLECDPCWIFTSSFSQSVRKLINNPNSSSNIVFFLIISYNFSLRNFNNLRFFNPNFCFERKSFCNWSPSIGAEGRCEVKKKHCSGDFHAQRRFSLDSFPGNCINRQKKQFRVRKRVDAACTQCPHTRHVSIDLHKVLNKIFSIFKQLFMLCLH